MSYRTTNFGQFSALVANDWEDITDTLDNTSTLTIADPSTGVGALQISPAIYRGGTLPHITTKHLEALLDDFSIDRGLTHPFDYRIYSTVNSLVGQSFHFQEDFVRVWYVSNGMSLLLITYVCGWDDQHFEADERETFAESVCFGK